jgi:Membrane domain of glycerophosphoryl diester phosphodiesterase/Uncharacterised protein family (UPF0259)
MVGRIEFAQLDIGRVVSRTFSTLGGNFFTFFLLGILFGGLPAVALQYVIQEYFTAELFGGMDPALAGWMPAIMGIGSFAFLVLPAYILIGAITHGAVVYLNGKKASIGECLSTGLTRMLPLLALGLLSSLGIVLGLLLFIIPGAILATRWAVAAPVLVAERTGIMDSFGRSAELARNNRWRIFWLLLIWVVLNFIMEFAFGSVIGLLGGAMVQFGESAFWIYMGIFGIYSAIVAMIPAAGSAALYAELRTIKEGASTEDLARLFD